MKKIILIFSSLGFFLALSLAPTNAQEIIDIAFPVAGPVDFIDDFGDPRYQHSHEGNDLKAAKHTAVVAANSGRVTWAPVPEPNYGFGIWIDGDDGYKYAYIHLNNDNIGTDDGNGGPSLAYAPGVRQGARVTRGQIIGWLGDSGNAESAGSHLHFEIRLGDDTPINPYMSLLAAQANREVNFSPKVETAASTTINDELGIITISNSLCDSGSLIKSPSITAVYYCGADGKRYVFSTSRTYFSWYDDFDDVITITEEELAAIRLGGNVTYRPGIKLVKIQSDPKVYAIGRGSELRWITSASIAEYLYGEDWAKNVDDIPETFFLNYTVGDDIVMN